MNLTLIVIAAAVAVVLVGWLAGLRVVNEHERGVAFRLGRYHHTAGPGLRYLLPLWLDRMTTVDVRTYAVEAPSQEVLTLDKVLVRGQAEAEREKIAKIISAEGELEAARTLTDAAGVIAASPSALQLRYLQTLSEIGGDRNTVVVFPMPIDLVQPFLDIQARAAKKARNGSPGGDGAAAPPPAPPPV